MIKMDILGPVGPELESSIELLTQTVNDNIAIDINNVSETIQFDIIDIIDIANAIVPLSAGIRLGDN